MSTYADLKAEIASDLRRSNLPTEIARAVIAAIRDHSTERFWFNETATYTLTLSLASPNPCDIPITPQTPILNFVKVDEVRAQQPGGGSWYTLNGGDMSTPDEIEFLRSTANTGEPARVALLGDVLQFWPQPANTYPIRVFGHYRLIELVNEGDSNVWTNEAYQLIRYTALKRLFGFPIRSADDMQLAEAMGTRELEYLRRETSRRRRSGRMAANG